MFFARTRHFDADGTLLYDFKHHASSNHAAAAAMSTFGVHAASSPTAGWGSLFYSAINRVKTVILKAATLDGAAAIPDVAETGNDHVYTASGTFKRCNEWYLDAFWVEGGQLFYDDGGMCNRTTTELSVFDAPSVSRRHVDAGHRGKGGAGGGGPVLTRAGESAVEFLTFLVWHGKPLWCVEWRIVARNDRSVCYEVIRGCAVEGDEFPPFLQAQAQAGSSHAQEDETLPERSKWRLGYAECSPEGLLTQPVDVPSLTVVATSPAA